MGRSTVTPLLGAETFELFTDHHAVRWPLDLTDASNCLSRWRLRLLEFDITVHYKRGTRNQIADA